MAYSEETMPVKQLKRVTSMRSGYVRIWEPDHPLAMKDGYVFEHRKVVYDAGLAVPEGYQVHHLNHDRADNRLENLAVVNQEEHSREHGHPGTSIKNQYGVSTIATPEERRQRNSERFRRGREERFARLAADPTLAPHGVLATYSHWGCRCAPCRAAGTEHSREMRRRKREREVSS